MTLSTHTRRQLGYAEGYLLLGLIIEAAEALAEIAQPDRDATEVLVMTLAVHTERGDWASGAAIGVIVCEREPEDAGHWIQWAYATRRHLGIGEARTILMRGLGLHPREPMLHFNLACYEAQLGNLADARVFLETACGLNANFVELAKNDDDLAPLR
jgi:Flp pilus assembly protein TadD